MGWHPWPYRHGVPTARPGQRGGQAASCMLACPTHRPAAARLQSIVQTVVRSTLSLTFVISAARVVFNIKARVIR